jgi:hypothetical protein
MVNPEARPERREFAVALDIDAVAPVRGRPGAVAEGMPDQYGE